MSQSLREALVRSLEANRAFKVGANTPIQPSFDPGIRVRRCYNSDSEAQAQFHASAARIVKAYRLKHINYEQAAKLMAML